ncbi:urea carboxylase-associated family protein [Jiella endophytica]|uniref:Urea carboxylase-associated family protein n=1 Tax=Jiella endophytica TaxID=2558362 RepID=A0A4Y8RJA0_9HYPH|nr:urea carboxylase-associated family protein [Jiella endophytica]TFF23129.1 urea carboxylase-associated family protein [Jiella endophytica]
MTANGPLETIPARHGAALHLRRGQSVEIVNTHGTQVVDCWAFAADDLREYMSMEASRVWNQSFIPQVGDTFVTTRRRPILTVVADTSPGIHDTIMAACDCERYRLLGVEKDHRNCVDNMREAMADLGFADVPPILASFNVFMNIKVQADGHSLATLPTPCRPGDAITLRAEMDCIVALSACPQDIVPIQGGAANEPVDAHYRILEDGFAQILARPTWRP